MPWFDHQCSPAHALLQCTHNRACLPHLACLRVRNPAANFANSVWPALNLQLVDEVVGEAAEAIADRRLVPLWPDKPLEGQPQVYAKIWKASGRGRGNIHCMRCREVSCLKGLRLNCMPVALLWHLAPCSSLASGLAPTAAASLCST